MPIILKHPNANRDYGAPKDWNEERDGPCASLPAIHRPGCNMIHLAFTPEEIEALRNGGSFQLAIWQDVMPVLSPDVTTWPGVAFDNEGNQLPPVEKDD